MIEGKIVKKSLVVEGAGREPEMMGDCADKLVPCE
jgi:hypothetical protein